MYSMVIIDDEEIVIDGLTSVIEWEKHQIRIAGTATNGQKGLDIIFREKPNIVLTDIAMPGLNGLQVIEETKKVLPETVFIIISGHAEFNYAKSAIELEVIDYLIKPVDVDDIVRVIKKSINQSEQRNTELLKGEQIRKYKSELVEKYLLDLMLGLKVNDVDLEPDLYNFSVLCVGHKVKDWTNKVDISILMNKIKKSLNDEYAQVYPYLINEQIIIIMANTQQNADRVIANKIKTIVEKETSLKPIVGIGTTYQDKSKISISYKQSFKAFQVGVYLNQVIVLYSEVIDMEKSNSLGYVKRIKEFFKDEAINYHIICQFVDDLIDYTKSEKLSHHRFKNACYEFINQFEKFVQREYDIDIEQFFREKFTIYEQLNNLSCINDYGVFLKETINPIFSFVENNKISPKEKIIIDVKNYLEGNYGNTIQLDDIAASFYIGSSYLSNLFSKSVGKTISEYLLEIRMNKAKELLRTTNYKVDKISKLVGYENTRYFNQVFKKSVKTTPSQYRSKHLIKHSYESNFSGPLE